MSKKLTLNIGLRYEIPVPKEERHHHNSNFCPTCPNAAAGGLPGAMLYAGVDGAPERFGLTRMNAFGPRLGVAYQLDSKTVIRAGGSIYYQPSREDGNADNGIQGFGGTFGSIGNSLSNGISYLVKDGFTSFAPQIAALRPPIANPATLSANLLNQTPFYYNPTAGRAPYFGDWNFTIERSLTSSSVFRASYHATIGNKLLSRQQSQNQLDPKYWAIYGTLLGQPISSVLSNPTVVAAGFRLPFANYPQNLQCPSCKTLYEDTLKPLITDYVFKGTVYLIHRDFPLAMHPHARAAAIYANASLRVNKYEMVCATLFRQQAVWAATGKIDEAIATALTPAEMQKVRALIKDPQMSAEMEQDIALGVTANVRSTPTMIFTHKGRSYPVTGAVNYAILRKFIDDLLSK